MFLIVDHRNIVIQILNTFAEFKERECDKPVKRCNCDVRDGVCDDDCIYDHYFVLEIAVGAELTDTQFGTYKIFGIDAKSLYCGDYKNMVTFVNKQIEDEKLSNLL